MQTGLEKTPSRIEAAACIALGASFHVLATPKVAGVELRVGLSDLTLGLTAALFLLRLLGGSANLFPRAMRASYAWLAAVFALLLWAYLRVGIFDDSSAVWARIKVVGFIVLAGYLVVGSWIGANFGNAGAVRVARGFVAAAWASALLGIFEYAAYFYFDYPITWIPRIAALAENPNAYGIMLAAALAYDFGFASGQPLFPARWTAAGRALIVLAVFLSASRSAYVGVILSLVGLAVLARVPIRRMAMPFIAAAPLFVLLFVLPRPILAVVRPIANDVVTWVTSLTAPAAPPQNGAAAPGAPARPPAPPKDNFAVSRSYADQGFRHRLDLMSQALTMWGQHPVTGAGLGAFWRSQQARQVDYPFINHNTTLWLASELGLIGLVLVLGGVARAGYSFVRGAPIHAFAGGVAGLLLVMIGASVGTEVFYQRYTWCFCGLGLAVLARDYAAVRGGSEGQPPARAQ